MYRTIKDIGLSSFVQREALPMLASLTITELFFKFHSFTLEAAAFLACWFVISFGITEIERRFNRT